MTASFRGVRLREWRKSGQHPAFSGAKTGNHAFRIMASLLLTL
jgi:hypothetical protein